MSNASFVATDSQQSLNTRQNPCVAKCKVVGDKKVEKHFLSLYLLGPINTITITIDIIAIITVSFVPFSHHLFCYLCLYHSLIGQSSTVCKSASFFSLVYVKIRIAAQLNNRIEIKSTQSILQGQ